MNKTYTEKEQALDLNQPIELSSDVEQQMQENVNKLEDDIKKMIERNFKAISVKEFMEVKTDHFKKNDRVKFYPTSGIR